MDADPVLRGCHFEVHGPLTKVIDATGRILGLGPNRSKACLIAARARRAEVLPPEAYFPALAGCHFGIHYQAGAAVRVVMDTERRVLGAGIGKEDAARYAARSLLGRRPVDTLSDDEFALLCTVVTVDVLRGKSGRAATGKPRLGIDAREVRRTEQLVALREALAREASTSPGEVPQTAPRVDLRMEHVLDETLALGLDTEEPQDAWRHCALGNGEHVILRRLDAPALRICIDRLRQQLSQDDVEVGSRPRCAA